MNTRKIFDFEGAFTSSSPELLNLKTNDEYSLILLPFLRKIKIGNQEWMTDNLNVNQFRNGDIIPEAKSNKDWESAGKNGEPAWCYYNNDRKNGKKYGKLYNWYAINDERGIAPEGWHIPKKEEFQILLGAVNKDCNSLKANGEGNIMGRGNNASGFSALLSGYRKAKGDFQNLGGAALFWSSTASDESNANVVIFHSYTGITSQFDWSKAKGFSIRCIKDE